MEIIRGKQKKAQRVVVYGPEGIGKTTFASKFPKPLFIDVEGSTAQLDVARTAKPSSWAMLKQVLDEFRRDHMGFETIVIDTADWAERLCVESVCAKGDQKGPKSGIEEFGYGKGYTFVAEAFGKFLNYLNDIVDEGVHVVLLAHSGIKKFELPEETGAYDRYELKMEKKTAPLVKEWADMVLFANYKTLVVEVDNKKKAQGGQRVMYTSHRPTWDAKNRHNLDDELPFEFSAIASHFEGIEVKVKPEAKKEDPDALEGLEQTKPTETTKEKEPTTEPQKQTLKEDPTAFNAPLYDLMKANNVTDKELQKCVAKNGYYPEDTPIDNYDEEFVLGKLVAGWEKVLVAVDIIRKEQ
jgi:hypothetical protein